jgi:cardiolipin synthase
VRVVANRSLLLRHRIRHAYLKALHGAGRSIDIANSYFIPDRGIRRALRLARGRGVEVRVLVPSRSDVTIALEASRHLYAGLLEAGVRIFEYQGAILHSKTVGVDGCWSAVGSYNMDHRSLLHNLEINLHVFDEGFGAKVRESFEADLLGSKEIRAAEWRRRPQWTRLKQRFFYSLRYWM